MVAWAYSERVGLAALEHVTNAIVEKKVIGPFDTIKSGCILSVRIGPSRHDAGC